MRAASPFPRRPRRSLASVRVDAHDLAGTGSAAVSEVRHVQVSVGTERHRRGKHEAGCDGLVVDATASAGAQHPARARRNETALVLQDVNAPAVDDEAGDGLQAVDHHARLAAWRDPDHARRKFAVERAERSDIEIAIVGNGRRNDMTVLGGQPCDAGYVSTLGYANDFAVVRLDRIQAATHGDHAVPRAFCLVVTGVRHAVVDRILSKIRDELSVVAAHAEYTVVRIRETMRAAAPADQSIQRVPDESHVGDTADETRKVLRRGQAGNDWRR